MPRFTPTVTKMAAVCCLLLFLVAAVTHAAEARVGVNPKDAVEYRNAQVPMRDGAKLLVDLYLPQAKGRCPAILLRTPYSAVLNELSHGVRKVNDVWGRRFAALGFAFVFQDCRGTGRSQGTWQPWIRERDDGIDLQKWVLAQPWCNRTIATFGSSYCGYTQLATAPDAGDNLKAMITEVPAFNWYEVIYRNGAYRLETTLVWDAMMVRPAVGQVCPVNFDQVDWSRGATLRCGKTWSHLFRHLPLQTWDKEIGETIPWTQRNLKHPEFDAFWKSSTTTDRLSQVRVPNLTCTGWYDLFLNQALHYVPELRRRAGNVEARRHQHLIIGPWSHRLGMPVGELAFGEESNLDLADFHQQWYRHWLAGERTGVEDWPFVRLFVMGDNCWRSENEWPLARTQWTPYYFRSGGAANSRAGNGRLMTELPAAESVDRFRYDPARPVPTHGGYWSFLTPSGPRDQQLIENRQDVLVFTSERLKQPLEVTGPVKVVLYAATDARDTDWTAKLVDVHPDGRAFNLCDGIIRARYRNPKVGAVLLEPNKIYRYEIDLWATSNVFKRDHRIRVQISSSNFPCYDRNPNTGHPFGIDSQLVVAEQTVCHDKEHPSHILLPIIPQ